MRIWIINPFDELPNEPGRPGRYWSLCHVLAEQGHEVVWWTADFSHRRKVKRADGGDLRPEAPEGDNLKAGNSPHASGFKFQVSGMCAAAHFSPPTPFRIRLVPVTPYQSNVGLARLRSHRAFGRNLESALRAETAAGRKPDRIVASWPPVEGGEVAARLGQEWHVPVTIDIQDAWPEAFANFIPGPAWVARLALAPWRRRTRKVFTAAERVSGVGQAFLDYARAMGGSGPTHLAYLGAWFTVAGASCSRSQTSELEAPSTSSPLRLLYLGNIGRSQDLATVVAGVALARAKGHDIQLDIAGSGEREPELKQTIMATSLGESVRLHGFLSGAALDALLAEVHIGVNPVREESLIACPNKVADYLEAGLPILNSLPGELAKLLAEYDAGRGFTSGKPETFAAALGAWAADPASVSRMSAGARRLGEAWFAREKTYPALARFVIGDAGETLSDDLDAMRGDR